MSANVENLERATPRGRSLTQMTLVVGSLRYFRRTHAALAMGIAAAIAVIVGALVVGDSVRGSLRGLVLNRLGSIECLLHSRTFFDPEILSEVSISDTKSQTSIVPGILLESATVESRANEQLRRSSQVQILGTNESFWDALADGRPAELREPLQEDEVAINQSLARELSAQVGDQLTLRFGGVTGVPADNPLGKRDDRTISLPRQKIVSILPDDGIGGLSFLSGQSVPRNVFCRNSTLQDILECGSQVNAALVLTTTPSVVESDVGQAWCDQLNLQLRPKLEDYGLQLARHKRVFPAATDSAQEGDQPSQTVFDYFQLTSDELLIDNPTATAVSSQFGLQVTRLTTYLANSIAKIDPAVANLDDRRDPLRFQNLDTPLRKGESRANFRRPGATLQIVGFPDAIESIYVEQPPARLLSREVPYSLIVGVDPDSELRLASYTGVAADDLRLPYCWINAWLAQQLSAEPGDWIQIKYFEPETVDGAEVERSDALMIAGVVPLTEPTEGFRRNQPAEYSQPPTVFNDPDLTPNVPGLTDKDSISNWDAPFELRDEIILPVDDEYYRNHRLTPKLFTSYRLAASNQFFGSRFGRTTALRFPLVSFPEEAALRASIEEALLSVRGQYGLTFLPVRANLLRAANGTTPFDQLFLALSFFVIVAALLLVTLLFKLGIQQRANQLGILAAQGYTAGRIQGFLIRELTIVTLVGGVLGMLLGLLYARAMIAGLESLWLGAISTPFLNFSFTWQSLVLGAVAGGIASLAAIYWELRRMSLITPLGLLRGATTSGVARTIRAGRVMLALAAFVALAAIGLVFAGFGQTGMAQAGSFFGSGMLMMVAALFVVRLALERGAELGQSSWRRNSLLTLAWRAISRNPVRSSLSLGLLAVASFLIASMGVFHVSPDPRGYGGFNLIGESSQPIYKNIGSSTVREEMIGATADPLRDALIVPMRARKGEDASCNNMFQVAQPTVLAIPPRLRELHEFSPTTIEFEWSAADATNPWQPLDQVATGQLESPIPVILDQNTADWSLKQGGGLGAVIKLEYGKQPVYFRTVGLLANSVLQGKLLIGQQNFEWLFPDINGYSFFMIQTDSDQAETVAAALESGWSDDGMDVTFSRDTLERLLGVQNTYISAFQSLGALGLLLGTFGLVAAQLRSVLERQSELALMQAVGFSKQRIAKMLTLETALLLTGGLLVGILSAALALVPYVIQAGPELSTLNPLLMLMAVLACGFMAALIAVRAAAKKSVLAGLRDE